MPTWCDILSWGPLVLVVGFIAGATWGPRAEAMPARAKSEYVVGTVIESNDGLMEVRPEVYDYENPDTRCTCPVCGGLGWVWQGTFTCDGKTTCKARAFVACGTVFVPANNTWQQRVMEGGDADVMNYAHEPSTQERP